MSEFKKEAIGLVESALVRLGELSDGHLYDLLSKELMALGADEFMKQYLDFDTPSSNIKSIINLRGPVLTDVTRVEHGATVRFITQHGVAEIYLRDPDTAMKVMAAFAKAGKILGGDEDEHSNSPAP
jgi:hypothetical protein